MSNVDPSQEKPIVLRDERLARLTDKQREVLALVVQRKTSKQIARILGISKPAVDQRIAGARDALRVATRDDAALIFMQAEAPYDRVIYDPVQLPETQASQQRTDQDQLVSDLSGGAPSSIAPSGELRWMILERLSGDNRIALRAALIMIMAVGIMALVLLGLSVSEVLSRLVSSS